MRGSALNNPARGSQDPDDDPPPPKPKGARTDATLAANLCNRLTKLDHDEAAELAASPAEIRAKFEERRTKALNEASEPVRRIAQAMRAATKPATGAE